MMLASFWLVGMMLVAQGTAVERAWQPPELMFVLQNEEIDESSGLAPSRRFEGVWYTHNDSGDSARFFRFDEEGRDLGEVVLPGLRNRDWEDMASVVLDDQSYLYIAEFGDNASRYDTVSIIRFPEPDLDARTVVDYEVYTYTYPEGPRDAEALMVDPLTGDIWIATKEREDGVSRIYRLPRPERSGTFQAEKMGEFPVAEELLRRHLITAGDWSSDGRHVVLRSYSTIYEFTVPEDGRWWENLVWSGPAPAEIQGEAVAYSPNNRALWTTTERLPARVSRLRLEEN